ncbi:MAG: hypothetical protein DHS20C14_07600 [Phycisphaeraceae bacterium]|nr:MAG: hypothetical protein DHS20C14_07600 [Phycisphaeraceae bacterium]
MGSRGVARDADPGENDPMDRAPGIPDNRTTREALACLRGHTTGTVLVDGSPRGVRFVFDRADGSVVMAMDPRDTDAAEHVLCVPDDSFDTHARALLACSRIDEHDPAVDLFAAYHGPERSAAWVRGVIAFAKLASGDVVDGDDLAWANPLAGAQTALCRALNADPGRLRGACERAAGVAPEDPFAVGVDPFGVDVRARFGVVRVAFSAAMGDAAAAQGAIETLLAGV